MLTKKDNISEALREKILIHILSDTLEELPRDELVIGGYLEHRQSVELGNNVHSRELYIVRKPFGPYQSGELFNKDYK